MGSHEIVREHEHASAKAVSLLYVCDFPPSNLGGGPILLSRLLRDYPSDAITVLTGTRYARVSPREGRLLCDEITVPVSEAYGRLGLGRVRAAWNWARLPSIAAAAERIIRERKIGALLTVLHGQFHFAAAWAARRSGVPYVVVVHDDYATAMNAVGRRLSGAVLRNAAHVYSVSPEMQEALHAKFGVESELQRPATERPQTETRRLERDELSIVYAGSITGAVEDSIRLLADLVTTGKLRDNGLRVQLHLYTVVREEQKRAWGWDHPDVVTHSWVPQAELASVLRAADILLLPFAFAPGERHTVETAFPSKTADYLASGTPILVVGPVYSSLVAYAKRERFAEIVTEPNPETLAGAIQRIAFDPGHRQALSSRALQVFAKYHDIEKQRCDFVQLLQSITTDTPRS